MIGIKFKRRNGGYNAVVFNNNKYLFNSLCTLNSTVTICLTFKIKYLRL